MGKTLEQSDSDAEIQKTKVITKEDSVKAAKLLAKYERRMARKAARGEETNLPTPASDGPKESELAKFLVPGKGALQTNDQDGDGYVNFVLKSKHYVTGDSCVFKF